MGGTLPPLDRVGMLHLVGRDTSTVRQGRHAPPDGRDTSTVRQGRHAPPDGWDTSTVRQGRHAPP